MKKKKVKIVSVIWDTDGKDVSLPSEVEVPAELKKEEIADYLSDKYGWLVKSFSV